MSGIPSQPWLDSLEEKERERILARLSSLREAVSRLRIAASTEEPLSAAELEEGR
jgi:hypothetical protein